MSVFQVILLSVFGASAIAGMLIFALAVGGPNSSSIGSVTIWGTLDRNTFTEALSTAADTDDNLLSVEYEQKDPATYMNDITNALASGTGPDLFLIRQDQVQLQSARLLPIPFTELSQTDFEDRFVDAASPFVSSNGVLGVPFLIDPLVLYWNRDVLNSAGYAQAPNYWDELYDMSQKITKRTETGTITRATVPFGQYRNVNNAKEILSTLIMQAGGTIVVRDEDGALQAALSPSSAERAQASLAAVRFFTEFADPSKLSYSWNASLPEARTAFISGDLALYYGLASEILQIEAANPNLNFGLATTTQRRNAAHSINSGITHAFVVPRTSKNPIGAKAVAYILAGPENARLFSAQFNLPSARRDVLSEKGSGTVRDFFNKQAIIVRSWIDPDPARTGEIFRAMIEDTVSGSLLLGEAVQRADRQLGVVLDETRAQTSQ